ncbi:RIIB protector from prophage-induced early lysis [Acinetobacter phage Melin]|nr:RIIB protector from prophage-induced early lysis [Acinetobacter phage Melin]
MSKLSKEQISSLLIGRASGVTQRAIAESLNCSIDTVRRIQNANIEQLSLFTRVPDTKSIFKLTDESAQLYIKDEFCAFELEITGDKKDGVIYANDIYVGKLLDDEQEIDDETFDNWSFFENDVGVMKHIRVGKVIITGAPQHHSEEELEEIGVEIKKRQHKEKFAEGQKFILKRAPQQKSETAKSIDGKITSSEPESATWTASSKFISIVKGRKTFNVDSSHPKFKDALQLLINGDVEQAIDMINTERAVSKYTKGNVEISNGQLFYKGIEIRSGLTSRIISSMEAGEDFEFYLPFLENLMLNPSERAVKRLFDFLQANDIEITADGHFIAWKKVGPDFFDIYSHTMDNSPGKMVEMPRNMVNEDDEQTCSNGLHVCSKSYLSQYASCSSNRVVRVKVHPRDVVSIPVDYNNAKMRTCKYLVIGEAKL